jgi:hypothetical protein
MDAFGQGIISNPKWAYRSNPKWAYRSNPKWAYPILSGHIDPILSGHIMPALGGTNHGCIWSRHHIQSEAGLIQNTSCGFK